MTTEAAMSMRERLKKVIRAKAPVKLGRHDSPALWEAIKANPHDDAHWLALADSLEDDGKVHTANWLRQIIPQSERVHANPALGRGGDASPGLYDHRRHIGKVSFRAGALDEGATVTHGTLHGIPVNIWHRAGHADVDFGDVHPTPLVTSRQHPEFGHRIAEELDDAKTTQFPRSEPRVGATDVWARQDQPARLAYRDYLDMAPPPVKLGRHDSPALWEAIKANPHDDARWMVLADSLEEDGKIHTANWLRQIIPQSERVHATDSADPGRAYPGPPYLIDHRRHRGTIPYNEGSLDEGSVTHGTLHGIPVNIWHWAGHADVDFGDVHPRYPLVTSRQHPEFGHRIAEELDDAKTTQLSRSDQPARLAYRDYLDMAPPHDCNCEYPKKVLKNGSGHGKGPSGKPCPAHMRWLEENIFGRGRRKKVKNAREHGFDFDPIHQHLWQAPWDNAARHVYRDALLDAGLEAHAEAYRGHLHYTPMSPEQFARYMKGWSDGRDQIGPKGNNLVTVIHRDLGYIHPKSRVARYTIHMYGAVPDRPGWMVPLSIIRTSDDDLANRVIAEMSPHDYSLDHQIEKHRQLEEHNKQIQRLNQEWHEPEKMSRSDLRPGERDEHGERFEPDYEPDLNEFIRNQYAADYGLSSPEDPFTPATGFLLQDGTPVNMGSYGTRAEDHRGALPLGETMRKWGWPENIVQQHEADSRTPALRELLRRSGAARVMVFGDRRPDMNIETHAPLTRAQREKIYEFALHQRPERINFEHMGYEFPLDRPEPYEVEQVLEKMRRIAQPKHRLSLREQLKQAIRMHRQASVQTNRQNDEAEKFAFAPFRGGRYAASFPGTLPWDVPTDYQSLLNFFNRARGHEVWGKKFVTITPKSREMHQSDNGDIHIRLYNTDVVTAHPDGTYTLRTGGYRTPMTSKTQQWFTGHRFSDYNPLQGPGSWFEGLRITKHGTPVHMIPEFQHPSFKHIGDRLELLQKAAEGHMDALDQYDPSDLFGPVGKMENAKTELAYHLTNLKDHLGPPKPPERRFPGLSAFEQTGLLDTRQIKYLHDAFLGNRYTENNSGWELAHELEYGGKPWLAHAVRQMADQTRPEWLGGGQPRFEMNGKVGPVPVKLLIPDQYPEYIPLEQRGGINPRWTISIGPRLTTHVDQKVGRGILHEVDPLYSHQHSYEDVKKEWDDLRRQYDHPGHYDPNDPYIHHGDPSKLTSDRQPIRMSQEDFLRAIRENPEDDAPRLVYADWLDDHGRDAEAAAIRTHVNLPPYRLDHAAIASALESAGLRDAIYHRLIVAAEPVVREQQMRQRDRSGNRNIYAQMDLAHRPLIESFDRLGLPWHAQAIRHATENLRWATRFPSYSAMGRRIHFYSPTDMAPGDERRWEWWLMQHPGVMTTTHRIDHTTMWSGIPPSQPQMTKAGNIHKRWEQMPPGIIGWEIPDNNGDVHRHLIREGAIPIDFSVDPPPMRRQARLSLRDKVMRAIRMSRGLPVKMALGIPGEQAFFPYERKRLGNMERQSIELYNAALERSIENRPGPLPKGHELSTLMKVGQSVKGVYWLGNELINYLFGQNDRARSAWVLANAILSPLTSYTNHTAAATAIVARWVAKGMPADAKVVSKILNDLRALKPLHGGEGYRFPALALLYRNQGRTPDYKFRDIVNAFVHIEQVMSALKNPDMYGETKFGSEKANKVYNFGLSFLDPNGVAIDTHMAKLMIHEGFHNTDIGAELMRLMRRGIPKTWVGHSNLASLISRHHDGAKVAGLMKSLNESMLKKPWVYMAYKAAIAQAAHENGWEPRQGQEAIWTGVAAIAALRSLGLKPEEVADALHHDAIKSGWDIHKIFTKPEVADELVDAGLQPHTVKRFAKRKGSHIGTESGLVFPTRWPDESVSDIAQRIPATPRQISRPGTAIGDIGTAYKRRFPELIKPSEEFQRGGKRDSLRTRICNAIRLSRGLPVRMGRDEIEALWNAVKANPHDDAGWGILADALDEHDRPWTAQAMRHLAAGVNHYESRLEKSKYINLNWFPPPLVIHHGAHGTVLGIPIYRTTHGDLVFSQDRLAGRMNGYIWNTPPELHNGVVSEMDHNQPVRNYAQKDRGVDISQAGTTIDSANHYTLVQALRSTLDRSGLSPNRVWAAIHDVMGSARASVLAEVLRESRAGNAEYGAAWQGLIARQPSMLVFRSHPQGGDSLYRIPFKGPQKAMSGLLDRLGVQNRVYVPHGEGSHVYVYDRQRQFRDAIGGLASQLGLTVVEHIGNGNPIGGGDDLGRDQYRDQINRSEQMQRGSLRTRICNAIRMSRGLPPITMDDRSPNRMSAWGGAVIFDGGRYREFWRQRGRRWSQIPTDYASMRKFFNESPGYRGRTGWFNDKVVPITATKYMTEDDFGDLQVHVSGGTPVVTAHPDGTYTLRRSNYWDQHIDNKVMAYFAGSSSSKHSLRDFFNGIRVINGQPIHELPVFNNPAFAETAKRLELLQRASGDPYSHAHEYDDSDLFPRHEVALNAKRELNMLLAKPFMQNVLNRTLGRRIPGHDILQQHSLPDTRTITQLHDAFANNAFDPDLGGRHGHELADELEYGGKPYLAHAVRQMADQPGPEFADHPSRKHILGSVGPITVELSHPWGPLPDIPVDPRWNVLLHHQEGKQALETAVDPKIGRGILHELSAFRGPWSPSLTERRRDLEKALTRWGDPGPYDNPRKLSRQSGQSGLLRAKLVNAIRLARGLPIRMGRDEIEALWNAVKANPHDDAPWGIFADALDEHGRPWAASLARHMMGAKRSDRNPTNTGAYRWKIIHPADDGGFRHDDKIERDFRGTIFGAPVTVVNNLVAFGSRPDGPGVWHAVGRLWSPGDEFAKGIVSEFDQNQPERLRRQDDHVHMALSEDEKSLRRSIIANPHDDAPKLIYSDWLEEHGDTRGAIRIRKYVSSGVEMSGDHTSLPHSMWQTKRDLLSMPHSVDPSNFLVRFQGLLYIPAPSRSGDWRYRFHSMPQDNTIPRADGIPETDVSPLGSPVPQHIVDVIEGRSKPEHPERLRRGRPHRLYDDALWSPGRPVRMNRFDILPFLASIHENRLDQAPGLVFADWLDEHGLDQMASLYRNNINPGNPTAAIEAQPGYRTHWKSMANALEQANKPATAKAINDLIQRGDFLTANGTRLSDFYSRIDRPSTVVDTHGLMKGSVLGAKMLIYPVRDLRSRIPLDYDVYFLDAKRYDNRYIHGDREIGGIRVPHELGRSIVGEFDWHADEESRQNAKYHSDQPEQLSSGGPHRLRRSGPVRNSMSDVHGLLSAAGENLADDAPHLILADALDEQGMPTIASHIRQSIASGEQNRTRFRAAAYERFVGPPRNQPHRFEFAKWLSANPGRFFIFPVHSTKLRLVTGIPTLNDDDPAHLTWDAEYPSSQATSETIEKMREEGAGYHEYNRPFYGAMHDWPNRGDVHQHFQREPVQMSDTDARDLDHYVPAAYYDGQVEQLAEYLHNLGRPATADAIMRGHALREGYPHPLDHKVDGVAGLSEFTQGSHWDHDHPQLRDVGIGVKIMTRPDGDMHRKHVHGMRHIVSLTAMGHETKFPNLDGTLARFETNDHDLVRALLGELPHVWTGDPGKHMATVTRIQRGGPSELRGPERFAAPRGMWAMDPMEIEQRRQQHNNKYLGRDEEYFGDAPREPWMEPKYFRGQDEPPGGDEDISESWVPIRSSWIIGIRRLKGMGNVVDFITKQGKAYRYMNAPRGLFWRWLAATSKGRFWWANIRGYLSPAKKMSRAEEEEIDREVKYDLIRMRLGLPIKNGRFLDRTEVGDLSALEQPCLN